MKAYDLGAFGVPERDEQVKNLFHFGRKARHVAWSAGCVKCGGGKWLEKVMETGLSAAMSLPHVVLGRGKLPGTGDLDVTLHLDHPEQPLSTGEQWGAHSSNGTGFQLAQASDRAFEEVIRACGCEWLLLLATEEKLRGRRFTPQEILARRPAETRAEEPKDDRFFQKTRRNVPDALDRCRKAIAKGDFEALEGLRDVLDDGIVRTLATEWQAGLSWSAKDAYAALLMDQTAECVQPLFRDALKSPTVETRVYALCVLTGDFEQFTALMSDGGVDEAKVDAAIAKAGLL